FYAMAFLGMAPLGSLIAGYVAEFVGVTYTLFACGFLCILSVLPLVLQFNKLRAMVRPIYQRLGILPEIASGLQSASNLTSPPEED
ncbi:MAG: MFS transporter, partial [Hymenobacteraceae bacterium]|nr:MFS transporter [Hymenobacteraceae bacterium]